MTMMIKTTSGRIHAWWMSGALVCMTAPVAARDAGISIGAALPSDVSTLAESSANSNFVSSLAGVSFNGLPPGELPPGVTVTSHQDPVTGQVAESIVITGDVLISAGGLSTTGVASLPQTQTITAAPIESDAVLVTTSEPPSASILTAIEQPPGVIIAEPAVVTGAMAVAAQAEVVAPQSSVAADFIEMPTAVDGGGVDIAEPGNARASSMLPGVANVVNAHSSAGVAIRGGHLVGL